MDKDNKELDQIDNEKLDNENEYRDADADVELTEGEAMRRMGVITGRRSGFAAGILVGVIIAFGLIIVVNLLYRNHISQTGSIRDDNGSATSADKLLDSSVSNKLTLLYQYLNKYYYEDVTISDLQDGLYKGLMEGTGDDYTTYYNEEEYEDTTTDTTGDHSQIGRAHV